MSDVRAEELREEADEPSPRRGGLGVGALARDSAIYGATRVGVKSLTFLLVPLYAHFLSPREFGVLEIVLATVALVDVVISANFDGVLARFYFDREDAAWRRQVISLYLAIELLYPAAVIGVLLSFAGPLSDRVFGTSAYAAFFVIALADLYLTNIVDLPMILARLRRKPVTFAAYSLARAVTQVVFSVLLVAVWHLGVEGILIASLVAAGVAFLVTLREWVGDVVRTVSWKVGREMIAFAWPGVIGGLAFYGINLLDRFFVKYYHGLADNGLYGAAFRFSQVVLIGVIAFRMGWSQWHYSWLHSGRHPQMVARGASYYFLAVGFLAVTLSAWILPAFHLVMPERYHAATTAVAPLALSGIAVGAYNLFAVGFNVQKRMRLVTPLVVAGAAATVGFNFLLIPPFSYVGAAWATVAGFTTLSLLVAVVGQRIYPIPWDVRRIGLAVGLAGALCLAALAVDEWIALAPSLPLRAAITLAYPGLLLAFRFFPPSDLAAVRSRVAALL